MPNQTIPSATAEIMIREYIDYMRDLGVDMDSQTQSVSFDGEALMAWLVPAMQNASELRIHMGRYPAGHAQEGRTTVILWPYQTGKAAGGAMTMRDGPGDPFNEGSGQP